MRILEKGCLLVWPDGNIIEVGDSNPAKVSKEFYDGFMEDFSGKFLKMNNTEFLMAIWIIYPIIQRSLVIPSSGVSLDYLTRSHRCYSHNPHLNHERTGIPMI